MNEFALKLIKEVLSTPKTFSELLELTKLPERTLRYNLNLLKKGGEIKEYVNLRDMRKKVFIKKVKN